MIGWLRRDPVSAGGGIYAGNRPLGGLAQNWHWVVPMLMGAIGLVIAVNFAANPALQVGLTGPTMGALTGLPIFLAGADGDAEPQVLRWSGDDQLDGANGDFSARTL